MKLTKLFESAHNQDKKPNPMAKQLSDPKFKPKTEIDKKKEVKKGYQKHKGKIEEEYKGSSEYDEVKVILDKHGIKSSDDVELGTPVYDELFDYFSNSGEMPYGVQKARTGMPDEWIYDRLQDLGLLETSGYEGQVEPTFHIFKDADIRKIADIIKQKDLKAYPEQTDDGVKVHTYSTDRKSVAQELGIEENESVDPLRTDIGAKEELAKEIYNNSEEYQTEYEDWEAFMNSDDFEEENMRLKSKFEQQPEPDLTADDHEDDDVPAFLKKYHDKEKELNYMRKLAGMSTASTTESYARMTQELIIKLVKQGKSNDEIQQATGETGARIEAIRKSVAEEQPTEATNDLAKSLNPLKQTVGSKQSTQMTAKGFDAVAQGERPTPQQAKAMEPFMSKIAKAVSDPSTQAQMRNIMKRV